MAILDYYDTVYHLIDIEATHRCPALGGRELTIIAARQRLFDGLAIGASALCLVHCLALPILIMLVPALAAYLTLPESFHIGALILAVPTSILALAAGYRRHRWTRPMIVAAPAIALLGLGAFAAPEEWVETALTVAGATALAIAHALNWRAMSHRASHDHPAP